MQNSLHFIIYFSWDYPFCMRLKNENINIELPKLCPILAVKKPLMNGWSYRPTSPIVEIVSMNNNIDIAHISKHYKGLHAAIQKWFPQSTKLSSKERHSNCGENRRKSPKITSFYAIFLGNFCSPPLAHFSQYRPKNGWNGVRTGRWFILAYAIMRICSEIIAGSSYRRHLRII